jgi:hypothetical protein
MIRQGSRHAGREGRRSQRLEEASARISEREQTGEEQ